jgi:hypothetical protein
MSHIRSDPIISIEDVNRESPTYKIAKPNSSRGSNLNLELTARGLVEPSEMTFRSNFSNTVSLRYGFLRHGS